MGLSIADVLGKVKPPVRSVWLCLDGELWARHDELSKEIDALRAAGSATMGGAGGVAELHKELQQVEAAMREAEVEFKFRGISTYRLEAIQKAHPAENGQRGWNSSEGAPELLSACAVEPVMTEAEARQLLETVHEAAAQKLYDGAWLATTGSADVPFSARAFASTSGTA